MKIIAPRELAAVGAEPPSTDPGVVATAPPPACVVATAPPPQAQPAEQLVATGEACRQEALAAVASATANRVEEGGVAAQQEDKNKSQFLGLATAADHAFRSRG